MPSQYGPCHHRGPNSAANDLIVSANERELLLMQLAANLEAVISQRLARTLSGDGRVPIVEVLRTVTVVRKVIREGRAGELPQTIGNRESGIQLFDQHLSKRYHGKIIRGREALRLATNPEDVSMGMHGITSGDTSSGLVGRRPRWVMTNTQ